MFSFNRMNKYINLSRIRTHQYSPFIQSRLKQHFRPEIISYFMLQLKMYAKRQTTFISLFSFEGRICIFVRVLSLFWVGSYLQRELPCLLFYVDMRIQIDTALKHFYTCMLQESLILCKHGNILLSLTLKGNTISNVFT